MTTMNARTRVVTVVLAATLGGSAPAGAQTAADTLESWTEALRSGSLGERVNAAGKLALRDDLAELPPETQGALVAELERVNGALLGGLPLDGQEDLRGEDFGEYYMNLVAAVGHFDSREARTALIPAVAVSVRTRQRVAVLGDEAVRRLSDLIARDYEAYAALETLALAWFWADSTGAPLSSGPAPPCWSASWARSRGMTPGTGWPRWGHSSSRGTRHSSPSRSGWNRRRAAPSVGSRASMSYPRSGPGPSSPARWTSRAGPGA
ncbi:MAG: hypothetical protein KY466_09390 [Gemmatimonadetes bacterium]|nr:hypothetical protein [Gemmatimonadota bacterium]